MTTACTKEFTLIVSPACEDCEVGGYSGTAVPHLTNYNALAFDPAGWYCTFAGTLPEFDGYFRERMGNCYWGVHAAPGQNVTTIKGRDVLFAGITYDNVASPHQVELEFGCQGGGPYWVLFFGRRQASDGHLKICGDYVNTDPMGLVAGPAMLTVEMVEPPP